MAKVCPTIVVAEDDEDDRLILKTAFKEVDPEVQLHFVNDGMELLGYLRREGSYRRSSDWAWPCLVVLDLNMPNMGGHEILQILHKDKALCAIPVVILSTSDTLSDVNQAYSDCANAFMKKPSSFKAWRNIAKELARYWLEATVLPEQSASSCKKEE